MLLSPLKQRRWSLVALLVIADMSMPCSFFFPPRTLPSSCHRSTLLHTSKSSENDRRSVIGGIIQYTAFICIQPSPPALAVEDRTGKKPFAPLDTLLPAARVLSMIDEALDVTTQLTTVDTLTQQRKSELLGKLENLLLKPQNFTRGTTNVDVPQQPAKAYLDSYDQYRSKVSILERPGAMLVQSGEIDTWKRLKRQEKVREDSDEVRAALNYYTSNLNYTPDKYVLTGSREERSKLIREDRLPDIKNVIASDMGLRYLLRNEILTALGEARAELEYQIMKQDAVDCSELLGLLLQAQTSCQKWFDLIDEGDRKAALGIVQRDSQG
mmetsp:Transcript_6048/g.11435  ORF Transcript_6048/g.11435 Transcript_6048/m.11435 type:complete len:326 (+) Transcript_6048:276-1253(+)